LITQKIIGWGGFMIVPNEGIETTRFRAWRFQFVCIWPKSMKDLNLIVSRAESGSFPVLIAPFRSWDSAAVSEGRAAYYGFNHVYEELIVGDGNMSAIMADELRETIKRVNEVVRA
jgi:hypothetical protein